MKRTFLAAVAGVAMWAGSFGLANAAGITLDVSIGSTGSIPEVGTNQLVSPLFGVSPGNGWFGAQVSGVAGTYRVDFLGAEARNKNQFALNAATPSVLFTTAGQFGSNAEIAPDLATPLASVQFSHAGGLLDFLFIINGGNGGTLTVVNGANPNDTLPLSPRNFFASFDPTQSLANQAVTGKSVYLFLDDQNLQDDNHDDMLVRITHVPAPAGLALLGAGLLGVGAARRVRREA